MYTAHEQILPLETYNEICMSILCEKLTERQRSHNRPVKTYNDTSITFCDILFIYDVIKIS